MAGQVNVEQSFQSPQNRVVGQCVQAVCRCVVPAFRQLRDCLFGRGAANLCSGRQRTVDDGELVGGAG